MDDTDNFADIGPAGDYISDGQYTILPACPANIIGYPVAVKWKLEEPRRGFFVGKIQGLADDHGDQSTAYRVKYARRTTGERTIDGVVDTELDPAEYGPTGEWVHC